MDARTVVDQAAPGGSQPAAWAPAVGIFDSGVGGFTVARAIRRLRPDIHLVYFGDTLNMPYGGRSPEQIQRFAHRSIEFLLAARHRDSGRGLQRVQQRARPGGAAQLRGDRVRSGVEHGRDDAHDVPAARIAWRSSPRSATVQSRYWERKLLDAFPALDLRVVAAPELVPLVEAPSPDSREVSAAVRRYLAAAGRSRRAHGHPRLHALSAAASLMMELLCPELLFIDPAVCLAQRLAASIRRRGARRAARADGALQLTARRGVLPRRRGGARLFDPRIDAHVHRQPA